MFICVWHLLTAMCLLAMGCYEAPDYTATRFKCDTAHVCPDNQICVSGTCSRGGGGPDTVGVSCGQITCAVDQQCCIDIVDAPHCTALNQSCDAIAATCDGIEDCHGNACCEQIDLSIACSGAATCSGQDQICLDTADCTNPAAKQCCFGDGLPGEPWGRCRPTCS
jgi:hypothetical protein